MIRLNFILFLSVILIFSCKTIEKKVLAKNISDMSEILFDAGFDENIKINGKLLLNYDEINPELTYNNDSIFDNTSDASSDKISENYIYNKNRLKEFKEYEIYFTENSENKLSSLLNRRNIKLLKYEDNSLDSFYLLKVKILTYEPGEFNLIQNMKSKMTADISLTGSSGTVFTLKKIYEADADISRPTEKLRLNGIIDSINTDIIDLIEKIMSKKGKEQTNTDA